MLYFNTNVGATLMGTIFILSVWRVATTQL